jgi:hypothetical protein
MSVAAQNLLRAFGGLPAAEWDAVITELLRRYPPGGGDLAAGAFEELAEEVFRSYDAAEATDATPPG